MLSLILEDELEVLHQLGELIIVLRDQAQKGTANVAEEKRSMYLPELHKYLLTKAIPQRVLHTLQGDRKEDSANPHTLRVVREWNHRKL